MGKTFKEISWKSKDYLKVKQQKKKPKHIKLEPYKRTRTYM